MCKKISSGSFKNVINEICLEIIYLTNMYKKDLALNNLQTKSNIPNGIFYKARMFSCSIKSHAFICY